jgi:hypothetical protein
MFTVMNVITSYADLELWFKADASGTQSDDALLYDSPADTFYIGHRLKADTYIGLRAVPLIEAVEFALGAMRSVRAGAAFEGSAERVLERCEAKLRDPFRRASDAGVVTDPDGRCIAC